MNVTSWIALGSNLGEREEHLRFAARALSLLGQPGPFSPVYETAPMYVTDQPAFLNAVVGLRAELSPHALLAGLHRIERERGRSRSDDERFGPRTLDLDLLLYGDARIDEEGLMIPHPRILERSFVLAPLADVAPDLLHPEAEITVSEALRRLEEPNPPKRTAVQLGPLDMGERVV